MKLSLLRLMPGLLPKCKFRTLHGAISLQKNIALEITTESVLGEENRRKCVSRLQRMPSIRMNEGEVPKRQAAVLIPLCIVDKRISLLYTLRSRAMSKNAGQVSFPGGMKDETDRDIVETAVREAHEELGLDKSVVDLWGTGKFIGTWDRSMGVMPVLGFVGEIEVESLKTNPEEVEKAFAVPLQEFCEPENHRYTKFLRGYCMPVFIYEGHHIWGLTATITHIVLSALLQERYTSHTGSLLRFFKKVK